jgi:ribosome-binding protein aMBF1 (putative translation factor)
MIDKKAWAESEVEYRLAKQIIEARLKNNISQRDLARKMETTQAVISRLETMNAIHLWILSAALQKHSIRRFC